jgi:hypothetical protein
LLRSARPENDEVDLEVPRHGENAVNASRFGTQSGTRLAASTTPVPPFTLFALKALHKWQATNSNNVKGGTTLAEARR